MEQTFNDLLRERAEEDNGLFGFALWVFVETSAGIVRENLTFIVMQDSSRRLIVWAAVVMLILLVPLVLTLLGSGVDGEGWYWTSGDFIFAFVVLFGAGLMYELVAKRMTGKAYKFAVGLAVGTALLLVWINAAVGIIGDGEEDLASMMYVGGSLAVGIIGALIARFQPRGMARALFATALFQILVAVIALVFGLGSSGPIWPRDVLILTGFFATLWVGSALLFVRASALDPNRTDDTPLQTAGERSG